jgi:hypothetical protein
MLPCIFLYGSQRLRGNIIVKTQGQFSNNILFLGIFLELISILYDHDLNTKLPEN